MESFYLFIALGAVFVALMVTAARLWFQNQTKKSLNDKLIFELNEANSERALVGEKNKFLDSELTVERQNINSSRREILAITEQKVLLAANVSHLEKQMQELNLANSGLGKTLGEKREEIVSLKQMVSVLEAQSVNHKRELENTTLISRRSIQELEVKLEQLRQEKVSVDRENIGFKQREEIRLDDHRKAIQEVSNLQQSLREEKQKELLERERAEEEKLEALSETWSKHEIAVEQKIRSICQRLNIDYIDKEKFPYSGKPDNALKVCEELVLFDSKSPRGTDLANFSTYIRTQANAASKYKQDGVKKDIFFVVPSNAIAVLEDSYFEFSSYRVHVIPPEGLEPVIRALLKIEDYEFAEQLSPEDRDSLVSFIGRVLHGLKRRIQIDHFFTTEFFKLIESADDLPLEFLTPATKTEQALILNPPIEKRAKRIELAKLKADHQKITGKAIGNSVNLEIRKETLEAIPLTAPAISGD